MRDSIKRYLRWRNNRKNLHELSITHPLRYLFLEVTRRCNLRCVYCGSNCEGEAQSEEMPIEFWLDAIRQIARDYPARQVMVAVTGGEPLAKKGIYDLFHELGRLGFPFGMVTNGCVMDEAGAKRIVASRMGSISISMDAPPDINDELRGEGVSEGVSRAVSHLQSAGFQGKLEIMSTITKPAVPYLDAMRRHVASLKVPLWRIVVVMPIGRAAQRLELIPDSRDIRSMLDYVRQARQDRFRPRPEFGEEGYLGDEFEGIVRPFLSQCRAGITTAGIFHDGRMGACPELSEDFVQGDLKRESFKEVWETRYQIFRDRSWTRKGACADCDSWDRCQGGSLHLYPSPKTTFHRCLYLMLHEKP